MSNQEVGGASKELELFSSEILEEFENDDPQPGKRLAAKSIAYKQFKPVSLYIENPSTLDVRRDPSTEPESDTEDDDVFYDGERKSVSPEQHFNRKTLGASSTFGSIYGERFSSFGSIYGERFSRNSLFAIEPPSNFEESRPGSVAAPEYSDFIRYSTALRASTQMSLDNRILSSITSTSDGEQHNSSLVTDVSTGHADKVNEDLRLKSENSIQPNIHESTEFKPPDRAPDSKYLYSERHDKSTSTEFQPAIPEDRIDMILRQYQPSVSADSEFKSNYKSKEGIDGRHRPLFDGKKVSFSSDQCTREKSDEQNSGSCVREVVTGMNSVSLSDRSRTNTTPRNKTPVFGTDQAPESQLAYDSKRIVNNISRFLREEISKIDSHHSYPSTDNNKFAHLPDSQSLYANKAGMNTMSGNLPSHSRFDSDLTFRGASSYQPSGTAVFHDSSQMRSIPLVRNLHGNIPINSRYNDSSGSMGPLSLISGSSVNEARLKALHEFLVHYDHENTKPKLDIKSRRNTGFAYPTESMSSLLASSSTQLNAGNNPSNTEVNYSAHQSSNRTVSHDKTWQTSIVPGNQSYYNAAPTTSHKPDSQFPATATLPGSYNNDGRSKMNQICQLLSKYDNGTEMTEMSNEIFNGKPVTGIVAVGNNHGVNKWGNNAPITFILPSEQKTNSFNPSSHTPNSSRSTPLEHQHYVENQQSKNTVSWSSNDNGYGQKYNNPPTQLPSLAGNRMTGLGSHQEDMDRKQPLSGSQSQYINGELVPNASMASSGSYASSSNTASMASNISQSYTEPRLDSSNDYTSIYDGGSIKTGRPESPISDGSVRRNH